MIYFIHETQANNDIQKNAGVKARDDLEKIFQTVGMTEINVPSIIQRRENECVTRKIISHIEVYQAWGKSLNHLEEADTIVLQFPVIEHTLLFSRVVRHLKNKGIRVVLFVHDLDMLRSAKSREVPIKRRMRITCEEKTTLRIADCVVVHNSAMKKRLLQFISMPEENVIELGIFDYLLNEINAFPNVNQGLPIIISGNFQPEKAKYIYTLPQNANFNLYGIRYRGDATDNINYYGAFPPDELPLVMNGSFGLVWDGDTVDTCSGAFGEYLRINNPHKTSLYLACGIPVIIWEEAALAEFILKNDVGITVKSLYEISEKIEKMTEEEYMRLKSNAILLSKSLRKGEYTKTALKKMGLIQI